MENNVLHWMYPPQLLTPDERVSNVLMIPTDVRMSPMDLLLATPGPQVKYKAYKDSFYHANTNSIDSFLNVVEAKKQGHDKLKSWLNVRALDIVLNRVTKEMASLRVFQMSIKDLTPEFLMEFKLQSVIAEVNRLFIRSEVISRMSRQKPEEKSASFGVKQRAEGHVCVLRVN